MKTNELKNLKDLKLSDLEKRELFNRIKSKLNKNNKENFSHPVQSPYLWPSFFTSRHLLVGVMSVFVLLLSSATAFASLNSLPGDLLYGVKTNIVEKLPNIIPMGAEARAKDHTKIIERRIDELEKLAEKNELTAEKTRKVEKNIEKNLGEYDKQIKKIKKDENKIEVEKDFQKNLQKRSDKIKKIRELKNENGEKALESIIERTEIEEEEDFEEELGEDIKDLIDLSEI